MVRPPRNEPAVSKAEPTENRAERTVLRVFIALAILCVVAGIAVWAILLRGMP